MNRANETNAFYLNHELEDKQLFIQNLGWLLSQTRNKVKTCEYYCFKNGDEIVNIIFTNGYKKTININMNSYLAIIKDVCKAIG